MIRNSLRIISQRRLSLGLGLLLFLSPGMVRAGELHLKVLGEKGNPIACRILLKTPNGESIIPTSATSLILGPDTWFFSDGTETLSAPEGEVLLRVEKGLEFSRFKETILINNRSIRKTILLRQPVDMKQRGYSSGENHLHKDSVSLAPMLAAEGLDFGTSLTWWNGPDKDVPIPSGKGPVRFLKFGNSSVETSIYDAELEHQWGAAYIQNLPMPLPLPSDKSRPNLDYVKFAAGKGALIHYQGGWSREVLLDALLGHVHVVNICNNNFAFHSFQPRSRYSNLLGVEGFPLYENTEYGMMRMNTDSYYRLLNCGLKLAVGAGSAIGVKKAPVGYNRVYVRTPPDASLNQFNRAWKAGWNFATNGPLLFLHTSENLKPGDSFELPESGATIQVEVEVISDQPLTGVELVVNGEVVATPAIEDPNHFKRSIPLTIKKGSWLIARCTAQDKLLTDKELSVYTSGDDQARFRSRPSRLRFAHTSPIYFTLDGHGAAVQESVKEGLQMLAALQTFSDKHAGSEYAANMRQAIQQARAKLELSLANE